MNLFERKVFDGTQLLLMIIAKASASNPYAYFSISREERATLYGRAYDGAGRRSSETPIPVADDGGSKDSHNRTLDREDGQWLANLRTADHALSVNLNHERARGTVLTPEDAKRLAEADSGKAACGDCGMTDGGRRRLGLCDGCYQKDLRARKAEA